MALNFSSFKKALRSLQLALAQPKDEFMRDSVIQRFEYTYELSWKMLKRSLALDLGAQTAEQMSRKELFRVAADRGLLDDPEVWFAYHEARNTTSHTYQESTAENVYAQAQKFAPDAERLLVLLEARYAK